MDKNKLSSTGAVVSAIVASLCCIGPVAVALIGVGSIGAFAVFEAYRPYLIGLTAMLLGLAFYLSYRKREVLCEDGTCKLESAGKWNKRSVWLATVVAAVALAFPSYDLTSADAAQSMLAQGARQDSSLAIAVLDIKDMDCEGCAKGLESTLARMAGVKKAAVEFEKGRAVVEYDSSKITAVRLIAAVDETGFKARLKAKPE